MPEMTHDVETGVIVMSQRDRDTLNYLIKLVGKKAIVSTVEELPGGTRAYVSNIAKMLKVDVPKILHGEKAHTEVALDHIKKLKEMFK